MYLTVEVLICSIFRIQENKRTRQGEMVLKKKRTADITKIMRLLDVDNKLDVYGNASMEIQEAVQMKLCQILKYKAGLKIGEFVQYSVDDHQISDNRFSNCNAPWTLYDYVSSEDCRINYCMYFIPSESDCLHHNKIFSEEIADWIFFLFYSEILGEDGRCTCQFSELEDEIYSIRSSGIKEEMLDQEFMDETHRITSFARQLDFCFSPKSGPITSQAAMYLDDLLILLDEFLTKDEIREYHWFIFSLFDYGIDRGLNLVSSKDVAAYYKYRHIIPDSDPRKPIAEKAVEIFLDPVSDLGSNKSAYAYLAVESFVIERPDKVVVICKYDSYNDSDSVDSEKYFLHPFYYEALQIVDNLLPVLEQEYAGKAAVQAV